MADEDRHEDRQDDRHDYWEHGGLVLLLMAMAAGPIAAALNLQLGYALVKWACATHNTGVLIAMTAGALATALAGAAIGWWSLQKIGAAANEQGGRTTDRSYFLALVAIGFNLLLALLTLFWAVPPFVLSPCE
jgi:hypothetical protein